MTVVTDPLVDGAGVPMDPGPRLDIPEIPDGLSRGRRWTIRRLQTIEMGRHPITTFPLHEDAPVDATSKDRYPRPVTCGTCAHLTPQKWHDKVHLKCDLTSMNRSERTDVRKWEPGCMSWREAIDEV